jgi:hypothetical protein
MNLKILADTSIVYNQEELLYQYISSVKLINAENGFTNNTRIEITLITSKKINELTDGTIYNRMVDWLLQKEKPKKSLDTFINMNTMDYTLDEIEQSFDNPYQMIIKDDKLDLTYKQIVPPRKLIETPLTQTGLILHYGDLTFFANIQSNQMTITPPKNMSCNDLTGQNNCNFSTSNKPKKLPILHQPQPEPQPQHQPQPQPQPEPQPQPQPQPEPSSHINVDPNIYPIDQLNANVEFNEYPKDGKYFYIIDYDEQNADILVAEEEQLQNSLSILKDIYDLRNDQDDLSIYLQNNVLFPISLKKIKPDENGNISLVKEPIGYVKNVKSNNIIVYKNGILQISDHDFNKNLTLIKSGTNYIIKEPSKKDKSTGMSNNELYAIIFGSVGGVLLIALLIYFGLRMNKNKGFSKTKNLK